MKKRLVCLFCVAALVMSSLVACGGNNTDKDPAENTEAVGGTEEVDGTEVPFVPETALEVLKDANPAEDNYLVLSGIIDGWAPVVVALDNDGNFIALVDYAGQATVNFAQGTYTENADGSITCEGTQYDTGEELIYEISVADGTYTLNITVPGTESAGDITGTK